MNDENQSIKYLNGNSLPKKKKKKKKMLGKKCEHCSSPLSSGI